ncbi:SGNH/GDSL hydrolase family protein [Saccharibacillus sp. CPCC 101409]|uniref:SGNH/GDSL hydrolase family protein n=1 Tax=Saccharibacillus sp. CPCC 101409 TaxID=3058041 RepID=UPI0026714A9C|nr:SGNH/GDSL hydrolase family protein [Saccharibacillus sp. CPCC 101409]MDO3411791.1 SGNH/GDSL hydrolase family protein [Saccharibacillus sp. CPCC 101409]
MKLEKGQRLVLIGDSITDCERRFPYGEGLFQGTGKGYAALVEGLLQTAYPERPVRVTNMGIGGNTVRDLQARWRTDVLDLKPDWLTVMIGINDVWRQFDQPAVTDSHVNLDEYEQTLEELVRSALPGLKGLVILTPFYLEPNAQDRMRSRMDEYGAAARRVAERAGAIFVDTQAAFAEPLAHSHPTEIASDRVHPNLTGHLVLARALLGALDFDWSRLQVGAQVRS